MTGCFQQLPALSILLPVRACFCPFAVTSALKCSHLGSHLTDGIREHIQGKNNHLVSVCLWESLGEEPGRRETS